MSPTVYLLTQHYYQEEEEEEEEEEKKEEEEEGTEALHVLRGHEDERLRGTLHTHYYNFTLLYFTLLYFTL